MVMGFVLNQILDWFAKLLLDGLTALIGAITHVLLLTPEVTALPQVQALTGRSIWIVDTVFVLVFVAAGVLTMVAGGNERTRYTVKDLLPRCIVGFVAAHFSQLIAGRRVELVVMVMLWTTVRVPGLMRRYITSGGRNGNIVGAVVRVVVVQQLTRGLRIPGVRRCPDDQRPPRRHRQRPDADGCFILLFLHVVFGLARLRPPCRAGRLSPGATRILGAGDIQRRPEREGQKDDQFPGRTVEVA
jgi:hypothetical protein